MGLKTGTDFKTLSVMLCRLSKDKMTFFIVYSAFEKNQIKRSRFRSDLFVDCVSLYCFCAKKKK